MNKKILIGLAVLFIGYNSYSQKVEITPQYGYQIGAKYNYYGGYIKLKGSDQYGVTLGLAVNSDMHVEFMWTQQNTSVSIKDVIEFPIETDISDVKVNHYQIGGVYSFDTTDVIPIFGMSLGWSTFNPEEDRFSSNTKFTIGLTGGLKYFFTKNIGIRLQSQLLMPIDWGGAYIGSGGSGVTVGGTLLQLNFSGGLIFAFGG
jgi:hypothetical protein